MTINHPKRRREPKAYEELDFEDDSSGYNEIDHAAVEALVVHLGSEHYLDGRAE